MDVGFVRQFFSTFGFFGGLLLGAWLQKTLLGGLVQTPASRTFLVLITTLGLALVLMTVGEYIGLRLKLNMRKSRLTNQADRFAGSALAGVTLLLAFWLAAALFRNVPYDSWQRQLNGSRIIASLNNTLPSAPDLIASLGNFIDPNSFPRVFTGLEPKLETDAPLPELGDLHGGVEHARRSTVKIQGEGCGGIVVGSGFVAGEGLVVTNAHVVAGVEQPFVVDFNGSHRAVAVWFDPQLDLAILRANNLAGPPLALAPDITPDGTSGAVLGYPAGGGFTVDPAVVLDTFVAIGRDIYGQGRTERRIYSLKTDIEQGNSGGPFIGADGSVLGVIFAESTTYDGVGYALTNDQIAGPLAAAAAAPPTTTGACSH